jgi:cystathionine beta-lyase
MEGTYLAWIDCRQSGIEENAFEFFLRESRVALSDGRECGAVGTGFVRLNFACTRVLLAEALDRMADALERVGHARSNVSHRLG